MNIKKIPTILFLIYSFAILFIEPSHAQCNCNGPYLSLDMDRFPDNEFKIFGDTIEVLGVARGSDCLFRDSLLKLNDVKIDTVCLSNPTLQITSSPFVLQAGFDCSGPLNKITWTLTAFCGQDTISESLSYNMYIKPVFHFFKDTLANLLNVDTVIRDGEYFVCDTSNIFKTIDDYFDFCATGACLGDLYIQNFPGFNCNTSTTVSKGRKRLNASKGVQASGNSDPECDTYQLDWFIQTDCPHIDTVSFLVTHCPTSLQIIPDSFPPDLITFIGDTILVDSCFSDTDFFFEPNYVEAIGNCYPDLQILVDPDPLDQKNDLDGLLCFSNLPTVTWHAITDQGGIPDTVASLSYKVAEVFKFSGFNPQLAAILNVPSVQPNGVYHACDTSLFENPNLDDFAFYTRCNSDVRVSSGRKKLRLKYDLTSVTKNNVATCDTFQITWTTVEVATGDTCLLPDSVSIFLVVDTEAPVFTFVPPDTTTSPGTSPTFGIPKAEDNCTTPVLTFADNMQVIGTDTVFTRTWTADDGCQTATASQSVTVQSTAIAVFCSDDILATAQPNETGAIVNWPLPQATTTCNMGTTNCQPENIPGFSFIGEMNGKAYYISNFKKKWIDAQMDCEANGGHLAIVDTPEKNSFLAGSIGFFSAAYIGLNDNDSEGNFQWLDGTTFAFQNWESGQPNGGSNENYVAMHGWNNGKWADYNFWTAKKYILEKSCTGSSGLDIEQVAGLPSGSFFPIGETIISYEVTDACGNSSSCSFSVVVEASSSGNCDENLAFNKHTKQSSTRAGGVSDRAVDGNTNGNFYQDYSVALTEWEDNPWWEVDIVKPKFIDQINLWNRTDCCAEHTSGLYLLVSDEPFISENLDEVLAQPGISSFYLADQVGLPSTISVKRKGRYVRVQMNKQSFLSLAEVEILGCDSSNFIGKPPTLYFDASLKGGKDVVLKWVESTSEGKDYFIIEKSTDNIHFEKLYDNIIPKENSGNIYRKYDFEPNEGRNYYRLKTIYKNGKIEYSELK